MEWPILRQNTSIFPLLPLFRQSSSTTRKCSITKAFQRKNVELSSKMQFYSKQTRSIQNHAPKLILRITSHFSIVSKTNVMTNYKCACVCDLTASLGTSMLKIKHGGRTSVARRTRGRYTKDMQHPNILIFIRAKRQGETCICYSTRKVIHLQVFYGGKEIGKQRTLRVVTTEENSLSRSKSF